jgi:hypothetical protein
MTWSPDDDSKEPYDFEPERFMVPPMENLLRRLFGARWGVILVTAPQGVKLQPIFDFLANYSIQLAFYSEFSADQGDFENLNRDRSCILTVDDILKDAKSALPPGEGVPEPQPPECVVRHIPRNPEFVFVPSLGPDIVGDVVQTALSGRLVVAAIQAEGSFLGLRDFVDLVGSEHLAAACIMGAVGLNTVARVCPECKEMVEYEVSDEDAFLLGARERKLIGFRGAGCPDCEQTGMCGRLLIHEGFEMSEKLRTDLLNHVSFRRLRMNAKREGMTTLLDAAWSLADASETTLEEVMRIADITDPGSGEEIEESAGRG